MCLVGVALLVLLGCCLVCFLLLFDSAWWNRGIAEEVTMASYGKAVTGTAVMARSANEKKKRSGGVYKMLVDAWPHRQGIAGQKRIARV